MKTYPLRIVAASLLLAILPPPMATAAEAQFTDANWVSGDVEVPLDCCGRVSAMVVPAGEYSIERTTDLETWEHLATRYTGTTGGIDFLDETAPGPEAYYRAVPLEP